MDKAFGMRGVGGGEDVGACGVARVSQLVMHVEGGVQPEPAVEMFGVVPPKEVHAVRAGVFERPKARGEIRAILEGLELRFRIRIVVRDGGARMRQGHAETASRCATGCETIDNPRSAWSVSCWGPMCSRAPQAAMSRSTSRADWRGATIKPTT